MFILMHKNEKVVFSGVDNVYSPKLLWARIKDEGSWYVFPKKKDFYNLQRNLLTHFSLDLKGSLKELKIED